MFSSRLLVSVISPIALSLSSIAIAALSSQSAEEVILQLGPANRSISVSSLEDFLENGTTSGLLQYLNEEQQEYLRLALTESQEFNIIELSQWLNSPMGEDTLQFIGQLFKTGARFNGQQAIRAAIITSLADDGELSTLELIQKFPTRKLVVDISQAIAYGRQAIEDANLTLAVIEAVEEQSAADAEQGPPVVLEELPDLISAGPHAVEMVELILEDSSRQRTFPADLFLPQDINEFEQPIPVTVLSHGLGDTRTNFHEYAAHMASHGIATVLPEHIGSNRAQKKALLSGLSGEMFLASEFLDRPLDITFLLDELEQVNETSYQGKLGLDRVGVVGHSFGGYTALALAGATIDFEELAQRCSPDANVIVNTARLLECRALELTDDPDAVERLGTVGLSDSRVAAVMGFTPVTRLFGESGISRIEIPVGLLGGAFDVVSPVVPQQALAFAWLQSPDKYLFLAARGSHTRSTTRMTSIALNVAQGLDGDIEESIEDIDLTTIDLEVSEEFEQELEEALVLQRGVVKSIMIGFINVHVAENPEYESFLGAPFIEAVSEDPFNFNVVRELPEGAIEALDLP
ncbi:MAG: alpha/beta hydrolase [Synechococcus sp.]